MSDGDLGGLFASLSAGMDAAIAREETEAADDLAFSLSQDIPLPTTLSRTGGTCSVRGMALPITHVGSDFLVARRAGADVLVPLEHATVKLTAQGIRPAVRNDSLVGLCRRLARRRAAVEIDSGGDTFRGALVRAGPDHLLVVDGEFQMAAGRAGISAVLIFPEGSVDEL